MSNAPLTRLRDHLKKIGLDGFIVPRGDEYLGENVPEGRERLAYLTGFTGSAGTAVIHRDKAAIFSDSRYTLQISKEVSNQDFEIHNNDDKPPEKWLSESLKGKQVIGYDPLLMTEKEIKKWRESTKNANITLKAVSENPIDHIWSSQPAPPHSPVEVFPETLAGKSSAEKRQDIAQELKKAGVRSLVICQPDSVAWLLNIRGRDVAHTPHILSRAVLESATGKLTWFIDPERLDDKALAHLGPDISVRPPEDMEAFLQNMAKQALKNNESIQIDPARSPVYFSELLEEGGVSVRKEEDPCLIRRAVKTPEEQDAMRKTHIADATAMVRFLSWLDQQIDKEHPVSELSAAQKLYELRADHPDFTEPSFETISGYGANGAVVHYRVSPETDETLKPAGLFLVDSGGQYFGEEMAGTTDITRTVAIGDIDSRKKRHYTRVLKAHFNLAMARVPQGTKGNQIDMLARAPLWEAAMDYGHGTGHGVGCYLSVHEESANFGSKSTRELQEGMILSNEPGYYEKDSHGIRLENLVLVRKSGNKNSEGKDLLEFETISLTPFDNRLILPKLLSKAEKDWLNTYHKKVLETLEPQLTKKDRENGVHDWLKIHCAPI